MYSCTCGPSPLFNRVHFYFQWWFCLYDNNSARTSLAKGLLASLINEPSHRGTQQIVKYLQERPYQLGSCSLRFSLIALCVQFTYTILAQLSRSIATAEPPRVQKPIVLSTIRENFRIVVDIINNTTAFKLRKRLPTASFASISPLPPPDYPLSFVFFEYWVSWLWEYAIMHATFEYCWNKSLKISRNMFKNYTESSRRLKSSKYCKNSKNIIKFVKIKQKTYSSYLNSFIKTN